MPQFEEQDLMAYADGQLPAAAAAAIAEAARGDAALAQRIERYAATRRVLQSRLASRAEEPVPQRLLDLLAQPAGEKVVPLRARRSRPAWIPLALAASLVLAVGLLSTRLLLQAPDALSVALESAPTGTTRPMPDGELVALSTLRTPAGEYCREYARSGAAGSDRGLACREGEGRWRERALPQRENPAEGQYQTASGSEDAAASLQAQRLDAEAEQKLIQQHWR